MKAVLAGIAAAVIMAGAGVYLNFAGKTTGAIAVNDGISGIAVNDGISGILAEDSHENYAWGYQYNGIVICADGSVYYFDRSKDSEIDDNLQSMNDYILTGARLLDICVANDDLEKMLSYISQIDPKKRGERKHTAYDAGASIVYIYDYANGAKVMLKETGDFSSKNTSPSANSLVKLITKYTGKARTEIAKKQKRERENTAAQWEKDVFTQYETQMPPYADLSDIGFGVWKHYKDEQGKACILMVEDGKIERLNNVRSQPMNIDNFAYLDDTDYCDVYTAGNALLVVQGASEEKMMAENVYIISIDDINEGVYNVYSFNFDGIKEKLQLLTKRQMTIAAFKEKVKNNEL